MKRGFSFIEVLIVITIATFLVLIVINVNSNISLLNNLVTQELQSKSDIDQTLQIVTVNIRSAEASASGAYPVDSASTSTFAFYSDIDGDGANEHVRYFLASSSIYRGVIQPTGTPPTYPTSSEIVTDIIDNVIIPSSTSLFSYYDASYTGTQPALASTADVSPIRLVQMSFYVDTKPRQAPGPQYFSALVDIRNLRSN
ncbi:MAG: prepilin-type N-terminal cleavage/methylation domain-containing protein [Minisyncoccia bacterium]|jgi:prepilin-type N-terminal cleavage/methylation domain-containing protein